MYTWLRRRKKSPLIANHSSGIRFGSSEIGEKLHGPLNLKWSNIVELVCLFVSLGKIKEIEAVDSFVYYFTLLAGTCDKKCPIGSNDIHFTKALIASPPPISQTDGQDKAKDLGERIMRRNLW